MNTTTERRAGIYMIRNEVTGDRYYGSSVNLRSRRNLHVSTLRRGVHRNPRMQNSWNKYGEGAFTFRVLAVLEKNDLVTTENALLALHFGHDGCMNAAPLAVSPRLGMTNSPEHRRKVSEANRGRKHTAEWRAAQSATRRGKTPKNIAELRSGYLRWARSDEGALRLAEMNAGRIATEETRALLSAAATARANRPGERERRADVSRGRRQTDTAKAKVSAFQSGRVKTPEHRAKLAAATAAYHARMRAERAA